MLSRAYRLTAEVQRSITAFVTAGASPHVAAEAAGIPAEVHNRWMDRGNPMGRPRAWKPHALYTPLWQAVMQARAQACLNAEVQAPRQEAVKWLMQGPGKETPDSPGWSQMVRPIIAEGAREINLLLDPQMQGVFAAMPQVLAPYPEARAALAQALAGGQPPPARPKHDAPMPAARREPAGRTPPIEGIPGPPRRCSPPPARQSHGATGRAGLSSSSGCTRC